MINLGQVCFKIIQPYASWSFFPKNPFVVQMGNLGVYQIVFRGWWTLPQMRAIENFAIREIFIGLWESGEEWFWLFEPFSKLKTTFSKHWILIEIRINMGWEYKEYKFKLKMVYTTAMAVAKKIKMMFLLD